ncbi:head-to-tail joining protein [Rhizobium phage RHph_I20]|uniref:Head-to-tail joining protein n=1 Tax=Rhizobium phage RHph_I20 TaxID=2509730 RepID=A0A7S5RBK6_9CAUD|nr:head-to-tail joining protein [Rhizobium phage RHph_I20]
MQGSLEQKYSELETFRDPYLQAARDNAALTIPALIPPEDNGVKRVRKTIRQPDDSTGSRGVNNLASKLLIALLPTNAPIFRMVINDFTVKNQLNAAVGAEGTSEVQKALSQIERAGMQEVDATGVRGPAYVMLQHLLVAGNYLLYVDPKDGGARGWPLHSYVVERDRMGNMLKIIIKEDMAFVALSPELQEAVAAKAGKTLDEYKKDGSREVCVFTGVERIGSDRYRVWQEVADIHVAGSDGQYTGDTLPYMPLRLITVDGEDYGRAYVSDLYGDLFNANELRRATVAWSKAASKVVYLVKPNATTKPLVLTKAKSGDFVQGNKDDITVLTIEKTQDFNVASTVYADIKKSLEIAFLLNSAVQRDAERVSAEEVRAVIEEINTGLGGMQSLLSNEFQLPFVKLLIARMERRKMFRLPKGMVKPTIVTGLAALGRSQDLQNLVQALNALAVLNTVPPEFRGRIKPMDFINRVFSAAGVDPDGLIMDDQTYQDFQQQQMMQQLAASAGPGAVNQIAKGVMDQQTEQVKQEAPQQ